MESVPVVLDRVDRSPLQNCTYTKYVVFNLVAVRGKGGALTKPWALVQMQVQVQVQLLVLPSFLGR